jgi:3-methyladenine DNA glycosylase AlkC
MAENQEQYNEITVAQFFELFMNNMDDWWKKHQFTTWGINKQFRKILSQILSNRVTSSSSKFGSGKSKPSYSSAMNH